MATDRSQSQSALHHAAQIQTMLTELIDEARAGVLRVDDLRARALFEVTAEVLLGLRNAYQDFEQASDTAWKKPAEKR